MELAAASRQFQRNIKIFSREYGVTDIKCNESRGEDLILVYTGENHYNSVKTKRKQSDASIGAGTVNAAELRGDVDEIGTGTDVSRDD